MTPTTQRTCSRAPGSSGTATAWLAASCSILLCGTLDLAHAGPNVAPNAIGAAVKRVAPAVVKLYGAGLGRIQRYGTGVIVSADGTILTTLSLMASGRNIRVVLADGRSFPDATVVRTDEYRQLVLLKIEAADLPFLEPVKSDQIGIGDTVIAIGNWYKVAEGDEPMSVTKGILSLKTDLDAQRLTQPFEYTGPVLIYDAVTSNPGAPGSPLVDIDGNLIGLVGRVVEAVNTNTRLNYALPSEQLTEFLSGRPPPDAARPRPTDAPDESHAKPYLGIKISKLGYRHISAYVARVRPGSPAAAADIRADDLIMGVNGQRIRNVDDYESALARLAPGQTVILVVKRGDRIIPLEVTVGEKP